MWGHNTEVLQHEETSDNSVDASSKGLGATLIQDDGPVAFASKVLTPTEQHYANNERELLACIFGTEHFRTYVFGRHFTIESEHKSLEQISMKNLADAPVSIEDVTPTSGLWFHNQVSLRRGNGYSRHLIEILTWGYTRDSPRHLCQPCIHRCWEETRLPTRNQGWPTAKCPCRHSHHWMVRQYQGCSESITTIPWTMWFTHCRGWTYPMWRSNHHSPGERKKVLEQIHQGHLGTSKCQYNVYIGLASTRTSNNK